MAIVTRDPYAYLAKIQALLPNLAQRWTPQQEYAWATPTGYADLIQKLLAAISPAGYSDVNAQVSRLGGIAQQWAPGGANVPGQRRTMAQQKQYVREIENAFNWAPSSMEGYFAPFTALQLAQNPEAEVTQAQQRAAVAEGAGQQQAALAAWQAWSPTIHKLLGPETVEGGPDWGRYPLWGRLAAAPARSAWGGQQGTSNKQGTSSWFTPRYG